MALRARSKLACKIADIDPLRLNEAVFAKHYNCASKRAPDRHAFSTKTAS